MTFRFDDVCLRSDMTMHYALTDFLLETFPGCEVIWGVSPLVHDSAEGQRVFPKLMSARSDYREFFDVDRCGVPKIHPRVTVASHGLIHADHRLLSFEQQEMSIRISCSLLKAKVFVPPFNKWDGNTQLICDENQVKLIKFEDGWLSMEHNSFNPAHQLWYLHARAFTLESFKAWFQ